MKKNIILIIILIMLLILTIIGSLYILKRTKLLNNRYELVYYDNYEPGSKYEITVNEDNINIKRTKFCSFVDCKQNEPETKKMNYSKDSIIKLKIFINEQFEINGNGKIDLSNTKLTQYQIDVLESLNNGENVFKKVLKENK